MRLILLWLATELVSTGENRFAGVMGGISTLSADARIEGAPPDRFSAYKPENGSTVTAFGGRHFHDYFSAQLSYGWNRNSVLLSGASLAPSTSFDLPMRLTMHSVALEAMAYFRSRTSRVRPYLAVGPGVTYANADATGAARVRGAPTIPANSFDSLRPALRVAVGIDWRLPGRTSLRYSFSETIQGNTLSQALRPEGQRNLANFQNWWGLLWSF